MGLVELSRRDLARPYEGVANTTAARAVVDVAQLEALARRPNYHGRRVALPAIEAARATT